MFVDETGLYLIDVKHVVQHKSINAINRETRTVVTR